MTAGQAGVLVLAAGVALLFMEFVVPGSAGAVLASAGAGG